ncbi:MAG: DNA integrity scanning protein DisA nucleotide-binding domain protein [Puniceicoccales bacterium]|nr:DNA integrity scanning protein DisA nucleotide-binding domain protein [Puniceicoccales bacterium]
MSFARSRLVNLRSVTRAEAIVELFKTFQPTLCPGGHGWENFLRELSELPAVDIGNGISIVCLQNDAVVTPPIAAGRCLGGLKDYKRTKVIFAVILGGKHGLHLSNFLRLMGTLGDGRKAYKLLRPQPLNQFRRSVADLLAIGDTSAQSDGHMECGDESGAFLREAFRMAVASNCSCVLFFADAVCSWQSFVGQFGAMKCIVVSECGEDEKDSSAQSVHILRVSSYSDHRLVQLRSAILLALSRDLLKLDEKVCCIGGIKGSGHIDSVLIMSVAEEYRALLNARRGLVPAGVKPEVFERLVAVAHEIAMEGREGHPVGTMFVVGKHEQLRAHYRSLVLNPFRGYPRSERNLLSPFMCETAKEFAALDGAFIIDGDGVLEAAGVMVDAPDSRSIALQGGLGTRHTAAAAFTKAHDCLAVVVSQSSGQVSLFRNGQMLALAGKVIG